MTWALHDLQVQQEHGGRVVAVRSRKAWGAGKDIRAVRDQFLDQRLELAALQQAHEEYTTRLLDLTERPRTKEANETLAKHLYQHGEQWFLFLLDASIPATTHRAEQALKGPIVNRKVWGGNCTDAGATAQEITSSVLQTCKNKALDAFTYVSNAFCGVLGNLFATAST